MAYPASSCVNAYAVAAARVETSSFAKMLLRCRATVWSLITSCPAISLFVFPRATSRSTSTSRGVKRTWSCRLPAEQPFRSACVSDRAEPLEHRVRDLELEARPVLVPRPARGRREQLARQRSLVRRAKPLPGGDRMSQARDRHPASPFREPQGAHRAGSGRLHCRESGDARRVNRAPRPQRRPSRDRRRRARLPTCAASSLRARKPAARQLREREPERGCGGLRLTAARAGGARGRAGARTRARVHARMRPPRPAGHPSAAVPHLPRRTPCPRSAARTTAARHTSGALRASASAHVAAQGRDLDAMDPAESSEGASALGRSSHQRSAASVHSPARRRSVSSQHATRT